MRKDRINLLQAEQSDASYITILRGQLCYPGTNGEIHKPLSDVMDNNMITSWLRSLRAG